MWHFPLQIKASSLRINNNLETDSQSMYQVLLITFWKLGVGSYIHQITAPSFLLTKHYISPSLNYDDFLCSLKKTCLSKILKTHSNRDIIIIFKIFLLEYSWFIGLCQFLLYSTVTQSYMYIHPFSRIIFHHVLPQEIGHSSLCYTVPQWLNGKNKVQIRPLW